MWFSLMHDSLYVYEVSKAILNSLQGIILWFRVELMRVIPIVHVSNTEIWVPYTVLWYSVEIYSLDCLSMTSIMIKNWSHLTSGKFGFEPSSHELPQARSLKVRKDNTGSKCFLSKWMTYKQFRSDTTRIDWTTRRFRIQNYISGI